MPARRFAQGSNGIYFGGKDFLLSEVSGSFAVSAATAPSKAKGEEGQRCARLSIRVGCAPAGTPANPSRHAHTPNESSISLCLSTALNEQMCVSAAAAVGCRAAAGSQVPSKSGRGSSFLRRPLSASGKPTPGAAAEAAKEVPAQASNSTAAAAVAAGPDMGRAASLLPESADVIKVPSLPVRVLGERISERDLPAVGNGLSSSNDGARQASNAAASTSGQKDWPLPPRGPPGASLAESTREEAMLPKATRGKRMALGFLSRVGTKDKYTKRLDQLNRNTAGRGAAAPPQLQQQGCGDAGEQQPRRGFAARLLAKKGAEQKLAFGSHLLGGGRRGQPRPGATSPVPALPEEEDEEDAPDQESGGGEDVDDDVAPPSPPPLPRYVSRGANPHSCSSSRPRLPPARSVDSDKLLFQMPFGGGPPAEPKQANASPFGAALDMRQRLSVADSAHEPADSRNPFAGEPERADVSSGNPFLAEDPTNPFSAPAQASRLHPNSNPFLTDEEAAVLEQDSSRRPEEENGAVVPLNDNEWAEHADDAETQDGEGVWGDHSSDAGTGPEGPQEGHLIAGGFGGGAESLSVSAAPSPRPARCSIGALSPVQTFTL